MFRKKLKIDKSILFLICSFLYNMILVYLYKSSADINSLIINIYSNIDLLDVTYITKIIFWLLPQLVVIMYTGNIFEDELLENSTIIFTRTNKRSSMLLKSTVNILVNIVIIFTIQIIFIIISSKIIRFDINFNFEMVLTVIRIMLYYFLISLIVNGFSILSKSIHGVYIVLIAQISMIYLANMLLNINEKIINYMPTSIGIMSTNDIGVGLNNAQALIYAMVVISIVLIVLVMIFRRKEIIY